MKTVFLSLCMLFFSTNVIFSQDNKTLTVGTASGYAPFVSLNSRGEYEGFDIDVAGAIAKKLGRTLVLKDFGTMPSLMLALKQNKVEMLIWAIDITPARMKKMEMVYYQGESRKELPFLFWKQVPENILSIEDLGKNPKWIIAIEAGTSQEEALKKFPMLNLKYKESIAEAILEIKYGKALTTTVDPSLCQRIAKQYPEIKIVEFPLPPEEQTFGNGICLNKENILLIEEIREAVASLLASGDITALEKKWGLKQ